MTVVGEVAVCATMAPKSSGESCTAPVTRAQLSGCTVAPGGRPPAVALEISSTLTSTTSASGPNASAGSSAAGSSSAEACSGASEEAAADELDAAASPLPPAAPPPHAVTSITTPVTVTACEK